MLDRERSSPSTTTADHDSSIRPLGGNTRDGIADCGWCGTCCGNPEHDRLHRMSESTWRERAA